MIKLIGFDLDDTLLGSNKDIPDIKEVKKAIKSGTKVVLCSGRPFSKRTEEYYQELGISEGYFCAYNGTVVYDIKTKEIVYENSLNKDELFFIMDTVTKSIDKVKNQGDVGELALCVHHKGNVYANRTNKFLDLEINLNKNKLFIGNFLEQGITSAFKFMIDAEPEVISALLPYVKDPLDKYFNVMVSMPCFIEIIKKESNKYNGLLEVAKIYGISEDAIMGFGDSMNDYELVRDSKFGIAMGNAVDEVKKVAKFVTDTNDNHGVKKALEKYNVI